MCTNEKPHSHQLSSNWDDVLFFFCETYVFFFLYKSFKWNNEVKHFHKNENFDWDFNSVKTLIKPACSAVSAQLWLWSKGIQALFILLLRHRRSAPLPTNGALQSLRKMFNIVLGSTLLCRFHHSCLKMHGCNSNAFQIELLSVSVSTQIPQQYINNSNRLRWKQGAD